MRTGKILKFTMKIKKIEKIEKKNKPQNRKSGELRLCGLDSNSQYGNWFVI